MFSPDGFAGIVSRQAHRIYYVHAGGARGMIWFDAIFVEPVIWSMPPTATVWMRVTATMVAKAALIGAARIW